MRIFTLGKNGIPLFFFALLLFSGTTMYGQEGCPTQGGTPPEQSFCYLETVGDIETDGNAVYQTDDNVNDTQPIPEEELLSDGVTYYVGGTLGDCDRIAVTVTVDAVEEPVNTIFPNSNSFEISPCSATNFTADDLASYFNATRTGYQVEVYTTQFGTNEAEGELTPGESYFVGQVSTTDQNACPSLRAAVGYNPNNPNPPEAEGLQTFCPGATVADLQAEGTYPNTQDIRWYRSEDANSPVAENTTLLNGQIYYASQIVNDRNQPFPPCESEERVAVEVVIITDGLGEDSIDNELCRIDIAETATENQVEAVFMSFLENPIPGGTFFPSIADITAEFNAGDGTGTYTTTYTVAEGTTCADSAELAVTVTPAANAGADNTGSIICRSDLPPTITEAEIRFLMESYLDDSVTPGGEFSPSLADITAAFNAGDGIGTFSTTYTVGVGSCQDSADLSVTVIGTEAAGNDNTENVLCRSDLAETATESQVQALFTSLLDGAVPGGTFSPSVAQLTSDFNSGDGVGTFSTTYTIGAGTDCEDSAEIAVTVTPAANAGADNTGTILCRADMAETATEDQVRDFLEGLLDDDATAGGDFSPTIAELTTQFNAGDGIGTFSTTYTVGVGSCQDSAELSVTVIGTEAAGNDNTDTVLCRTDLAETATEEQVETLFTSLIDSAISGGTFSPSIAQLTSDFNSGDGVGTFSTTYTIGAGTSCEDSADIAVTINAAANAGADNTSTILCRSEVAETPTAGQVRAFYLGLLDENATPGGIFSPTMAELTAEFNAGDGIGSFTTTYTVGGGTACEDSAVISVTVIGDNAAGEDNTENDICLNTETASSSEVEILFSNLITSGFTGGTFDPSIEALTTQINDSDGTGTFSTTYTIGQGTACEDSAELAITIVGDDNGNAGVDNTSTVLCRSEVADTPTEVQVTTFFEGLLDENATSGGVFSPTMAELTAQFNAGDGIGTFSTTYTVGQGTACEDSAVLSVTVIGDNAAGEDNTDNEICLNTETASSSEVEILFSNLITSGFTGGTFNPSIEALTTQLNNSDGTGTFSTTYTIGQGTACEDSAELAVTIIGNSGDAGPDNTNTVLCRSEVAENPTEGQIRTFFEGLLGDSATSGGVFSPSITELTAEFNAGDGIGTFSTIYTVGQGTACEDSAELAVTVIGDNAAGENNTSTVLCRNEVAETPTVNQVRTFFLNLLDDEVSQLGTFSPSIEDITADFNSGDGIGTFSTTYTIGSGTACEDSAELQVSVVESPDAGESVTVNLEEDATATVDLFAELGGTPDAGGTWTFDGNDVDGTFDPATDAEGVYTYTVTSDNGCSASATVTVIVGTQEPECNEENTPAAPTVTPFDGCASDNATVADLEISGEDDAVFTVYSDETLLTELEATQELATGTYYVTQTNTTGCVSDPATATVTLSDVDSPEFVSQPETLCASDDFTVADLEGRVVESGDIVWYSTATGTETISDSTPLQDGATYYAAAVDATTGCESSQRLLVNVTLEDCEIVIPEIFSPNGDDINDTFVIKGISSKYPNHMLEIYNRWGEPVYIGKGENTVWDGTSSEGSFGSGVVPAGVYFYILYYNDGQTAPTQGRLYLSR